MSRRNLAADIFEALEYGPLSEEELAERLWPVEEFPSAWKRPEQGGPYGWKRTLGSAIKRYKLRESTRAHGRRTVALPIGCVRASQLMPVRQVKK